MSKKLVYICSPFRGNYEDNTENAMSYCRVIMRHCPDVIPIAPHLYFPRFLCDTDEDERKLGMDAGIALLDNCSEMWVFGIDKPSEGMRAEIEHAKKYGTPIRDGFKVLEKIITESMKG